MEVHVPDQHVTTWRQFITHIAIVTVGLLLALSLESLVQLQHHRSLVHEARGNIQREIRENQAQLKENQAAVLGDQARMLQNLKLLAAMRSSNTDPPHLQYSLSWSRFSDTAWSTARDTGALGFMQYDEVQCYAGVYAQQKIINDLAMDLFQKQIQAIAPVFITGSPAGMTSDERERVLQRSSDLLAELKGLEQTMAQWNTECAGSILKP